MKFFAYITDVELNAMAEDYYDYSKGKICLIDSITYLAINISHFNTKSNITYALFRWDEVVFSNREDNISSAENISPSIVSFANATINATFNGTIPIADRRKLKAIININNCQALPNRTGYYKQAASISMEESNDAHNNTSYTIKMGNHVLCTISNKNGAEYMFNALNKSIYRFIMSWLSCMKE